MKFIGRGILALGIVLACVACAGGDSPSPTPTQPRPTATIPPTAPPSPTAALWPTSTPYVLCQGAIEPRLILSERGRVTLTDDGKWLNLRAGPGIEFAVIAQLAPLEGFMARDSVACAGPYAWYEVEWRGTVGWIAEGVDGQYFAEPWLPG